MHLNIYIIIIVLRLQCWDRLECNIIYIINDNFETIYQY